VLLPPRAASRCDFEIASPQRHVWPSEPFLRPIREHAVKIVGNACCEPRHSPSRSHGGVLRIVRKQRVCSRTKTPPRRFPSKQRMNIRMITYWIRFTASQNLKLLPCIVRSLSACFRPSMHTAALFRRWAPEYDDPFTVSCFV
jgi:hypothetical protein